jgi:hypothetical protein
LIGYGWLTPELELAIVEVGMRAAILKDNELAYRFWLATDRTSTRPL